MKHVCSTADISFWRAVNAKLIMNHGEEPALAGEVRNYFGTIYTPDEAARRIAGNRLLAFEVNSDQRP